MTTQRLGTVLVAWLVCGGCGNENPMGPSQARERDSAHAEKASPGAPVSADAGPPVLYDARDRGKLPLGVERAPKLSPEVEKLVLSALSPTVEAMREECPDSEGATFRVTASAPGAFTAPGTRQVAYIVAGGGCAAAEPGATGGPELVIVEGDKLVIPASGKAAASPGEPPSFQGTDIRAVVDLDQDGTSELLVASNLATPPAVEEVARLYTLAGGVLKGLREFPGVYVDSCAADAKGKARAQVIHYAPGAKQGATRYSADQYEAPCPASGAPKPSDFQPVKPPSAAPASPAPSSTPSAQPSP